MMGAFPLLADVSDDSHWVFHFVVEWDNPIFYLNAVGLLFAILLVAKLRSLRDRSGLHDGAYWASLVVAIGTGFHFFGDLTDFPELWDHRLIHTVVLAALVMLFVKLRRDD